MCIYIYIYIHISMCVYTYIYIFLCVYVYIYIYIFLCVYVYIYIHTLSFESTTYFRYNWENQVLAICSLFMYLLPFSILGVIWHPLAIHHPFTPPLAPLGLQSRPDRGCGQRFDQVPPIRCCTNFLYDVYYQVYPYMRSFFSD